VGVDVDGLAAAFNVLEEFLEGYHVVARDEDALSFDWGTVDFGWFGGTEELVVAAVEGGQDCDIDFANFETETK